MAENIKGSGPAVFRHWDRNLGAARLNILRLSASKAVLNILPSEKMKNKAAVIDNKINDLLVGPYRFIAENNKLLGENTKLTRTISDAEETLKTKEKFFNIMAHDLKNPIGGITSFCDLISSMDDINEIKESIGIMSKVANGTHDLLVQLNELRKANAGELKLTEFNLYEAVNSVLGTARVSADLKNLSLINSISGDLSIKADRTIMEMVIRNLISNAIKFTDSGSVEIRATSVNGSPVEISVIDTGIGISKETMNKLLVKRDFVTNIGSRGETGTGFGIPLVLEYAKLLGGELVGESEEGKGTTFTFTVPKKLHLEPQA
jgi:two-component system, sensor histidine kinase and response regulator